MKIEPLTKEIFDQAISLNISHIRLNFSGGSDEGRLEISAETIDGVPLNEKEWNLLHGKIDEWAWSAYSYNGAGDGNDYGDDVVYDLVNKKVNSSEWCMERHDEDDGEVPLEIL